MDKLSLLKDSELLGEIVDLLKNGAVFEFNGASLRWYKEGDCWEATSSRHRLIHADINLLTTINVLKKMGQ